MDFKYTSKPFKTCKEAKKEIKEIKEGVCEALGVERSQVRIPNGLIMLRGKDETTGNYLNLTNTIGEFNEWINKDSFNEYVLYCHVQSK
nr:MAG TPA: hypothetical protein [Herelleviridae sp.]